MSGGGPHPREAGAAGAGVSLGLRALSKRYEGSGAPALDGVSLDVAAGEFVSLLGASGSGKTTTLMIVAGFTPPDAGEVFVDGRPIVHLPPERRGIGVVFQSYALFPHMSALRNVVFPLRMRGAASGEATRRAERALERVGLAGLGHRLPGELSGGQQQRVALARAIVFEPGLLLMDEPLGALDRALREQMKAEIRRLHRELGITILYVTHDQEEALTLSDRIALMDRGRIVQLGSASDLYERPASAFVARFIGESSIVEGTVTATGDGGIGLAPDLGGPVLPGSGTLRPGDPAALLLRPEKLLVRPSGDPDGGLAARVEDIVYVGDVSRLELALGGSLRVTAKQANRRDIFQPRIGDDVRVRWARDEALLLPASVASTTPTKERTHV
ncbi:MAG: ABC transporter ATP-binding protein [Alphaproteobacteria bacterium]|nr:ABC transporter ATP-binding protein [Alphaproteobacteria bacterium]